MATKQPRNAGASAAAPAEPTATTTAEGGAQVEAGANGLAESAAIGPDEIINATELEAFLGSDPTFPMVLQVTNKMPQRLVIPGVSGLFLGHVAGKPEEATRTVLFKSMDVLHRMTVDVLSIASLSGHKAGVLLERVDQSAE